MKKIFITFLLLLSCLTLGGCGKNDNTGNENEFGVVEQITIASLVDKFNSEITDNSELEYLYDENMTVEEDRYWYDIDEGLYLVIDPTTFSNDVNEDIVDMSRLYVDKETANMENATTYLEFLLMANNDSLTKEEITSLVTDAKEVSKESSTANNGKGLSLGYLETDDHIEYQIIRLYK